jgi:hypothetical protein
MTNLQLVAAVEKYYVREPLLQLLNRAANTS